MSVGKEARVHGEVRAPGAPPAAAATLLAASSEARSTQAVQAAGRGAPSAAGCAASRSSAAWAARPCPCHPSAQRPQNSRTAPRWRLMALVNQPTFAKMGGISFTLFSIFIVEYWWDRRRTILGRARSTVAAHAIRTFVNTAIR